MLILTHPTFDHQMRSQNMSSGQPPPTPTPPLPLQPVDEELWYYGEVSRRDAEQLLRKDGDYLIRLNRDRVYVLTMKWQGGPKHFLVQTTDDNPVGGRWRGGECVSEREIRVFGCETDPVVGCSPSHPTTVYAQETLSLLQALHPFIFTTFLSHSRQDITWKRSRSFQFVSC